MVAAAIVSMPPVADPALCVPHRHSVARDGANGRSSASPGCGGDREQHEQSSAQPSSSPQVQHDIERKVNNQRPAATTRRDQLLLLPCMSGQAAVSQSEQSFRSERTIKNDPLPPHKFAPPTRRHLAIDHRCTCRRPTLRLR